MIVECPFWERVKSWRDAEYVSVEFMLSLCNTLTSSWNI